MDNLLACLKYGQFGSREETTGDVSETILLNIFPKRKNAADKVFYLLDETYQQQGVEDIKGGVEHR